MSYVYSSGDFSVYCEKDTVSVMQNKATVAHSIATFKLDIDGLSNAIAYVNIKAKNKKDSATALEYARNILQKGIKKSNNDWIFN